MVDISWYIYMYYGKAPFLIGQSTISMAYGRYIYIYLYLLWFINQLINRGSPPWRNPLPWNLLGIGPSFLRSHLTISLNQNFTLMYHIRINTPNHNFYGWYINDSHTVGLWLGFPHYYIPNNIFPRSVWNYSSWLTQKIL